MHLLSGPHCCSTGGREWECGEGWCVGTHIPIDGDSFIGIVAKLLEK